MKRVVITVWVFLVCISCSHNDNDSIDCRLFDPIFPSLYVKFIDGDRTNLLGNGTINPDSLRVKGSFPNAGALFIPPNGNVAPNADSRRYENTLELMIPRQTSFEYVIYFSQSDSIKVDFTTEFTKIDCGLTYYTPVAGTYRGNALELGGDDSLRFLAELQL